MTVCPSVCPSVCLLASKQNRRKRRFQPGKSLWSYDPFWMPGFVGNWMRPRIWKSLRRHFQICAWIFECVHLSRWPPIHPYVHPSIRQLVRPSVHPSVRLSIGPYIGPSVHRSIGPSVWRSARWLVCRSVRRYGGLFHSICANGYWDETLSDSMTS